MQPSFLANDLQTWPIFRLAPYARTHSDEQVAQIAASIAEFGWTNPVLGPCCVGWPQACWRAALSWSGGEAGIEAMAMLSKGQVRAVSGNDLPAQRAFVHRVFGLAA